jgi:hypothetical protein
MEDLDKGRRLARRRMGWTAFLALVAELIFVLVGVVYGGPLFAANLAAASPLLSGISWAFAAIVGAYLGVSLTEALKK